jgi:hypothetical protein
MRATPSGCSRLASPCHELLDAIASAHGGFDDVASQGKILAQNPPEGFLVFDAEDASREEGDVGWSAGTLGLRFLRLDREADANGRSFPDRGLNRDLAVVSPNLAVHRRESEFRVAQVFRSLN